MTLQGVTNRVYSILGRTTLLDSIANGPEILRLNNTAGQNMLAITTPVAALQYCRANELGRLPPLCGVI
jgi:hypothetical protein